MHNCNATLNQIQLKSMLLLTTFYCNLFLYCNLKTTGKFNNDFTLIFCIVIFLFSKVLQVGGWGMGQKSFDILTLVWVGEQKMPATFSKSKILFLDFLSKIPNSTKFYSYQTRVVSGFRSCQNIVYTTHG